MIKVLGEGEHERIALLTTLVLDAPASTVTSFFCEPGTLFNSRRDWRGILSGGEMLADVPGDDASGAMTAAVRTIMIEETAIGMCDALLREVFKRMRTALSRGKSEESLSRLSRR